MSKLAKSRKDNYENNKSKSTSTTKYKGTVTSSRLHMNPFGNISHSPYKGACVYHSGDPSLRVVGQEPLTYARTDLTGDLLMYDSANSSGWFKICPGILNTILSSDISPVNSYLSNISRNYAFYAFRKFRITYTPTVPTTTPGCIIAGSTDLVSSAKNTTGHGTDIFPNAFTALRAGRTQVSQVFEPFVLDVPLVEDEKVWQNSTGPHYTGDPYASSNVVSSGFYQAMVYMSSFSVANNLTCGIFMLDYVLDLYGVAPTNAHPVQATLPLPSSADSYRDEKGAAPVSSPPREDFAEFLRKAGPARSPGDGKDDIKLAPPIKVSDNSSEKDYEMLPVQTPMAGNPRTVSNSYFSSGRVVPNPR